MRRSLRSTSSCPQYSQLRFGDCGREGVGSRDRAWATYGRHILVKGFGAKMSTGFKPHPSLVRGQDAVLCEGLGAGRMWYGLQQGKKAKASGNERKPALPRPASLVPGLVVLWAGEPRWGWPSFRGFVTYNQNGPTWSTWWLSGIQRLCLVGSYSRGLLLPPRSGCGSCPGQPILSYQPVGRRSWVH